MNNQINGLKLLTTLVLDDLNGQVKDIPVVGPILAAIYIQPWMVLFPYKR